MSDTMPVYRVTMLVLDLNHDMSIKDLKATMEGVRHVYASVLNIECRRVEWSDDHPLNRVETQARSIVELFDE